MNDECLICGAELVYLDADEELECAVCHRRERGRTRCVRGHYVCDGCHSAGLDGVAGFCLSQRSRAPAEILDRLMDLPFCHMHGPEHHVLVGAALLTACRNAGTELDLPGALAEMLERGRKVPGGACGFWGACGAGISAGMAVSILSRATPLSGESYGLANRATARALAAIGAVGGPRCCKRNAWLTLRETTAFLREELGIPLEPSGIVCTRSERNNQCLGPRCPFFQT